jgi:hypothetical protein
LALHIGFSRLFRHHGINGLFQVPNVWGHLNVIAKGSGQAVVQMDINFGVDYEGFRELAVIETFNLEVKEFYSTFRNKSFITIQSCFR